MSGQVITVGVDGTTSSAEAVRFALEEARLRGGTVRAVTVWETDTFYTGRGFALLEEERTAHEKAASELQDRAIQVVLREAADAPTIERRVVQGDPGYALVDLSRDAVLLVVGTEHKGALKRVVVASISAYCTRYSKTPVVVVPFVDHTLRGLED